MHKKSQLCSPRLDYTAGWTQAKSTKLVIVENHFLLMQWCLHPGLDQGLADHATS